MKTVLTFIFCLVLINLFGQKKVVKKQISDPFDILMNYMQSKGGIDSLNRKVIPDNLLEDGMKYFALGEKLIMSMDNDLRKEDYKEAKDYFDKAIYYGYENALVYAEKGFCEYSLNEFENAIKDMTYALNLNLGYQKMAGVKNVNVFVQNKHYEITDSGYVYWGDATCATLWIRPGLIIKSRGVCKLNLEDYRGALSDFNLASDYSYERSFDLYFKRGCAKASLKDYLGAKMDFNKSISINKEIGTAYFNRGLCNYRLGIKNDACLDWSKAGELGYSDAYKLIKENCKN